MTGWIITTANLIAVCWAVQLTPLKQAVESKLGNLPSVAVQAPPTAVSGAPVTVTTPTPTDIEIPLPQNPVSSFFYPHMRHVSTCHLWLKRLWLAALSAFCTLPKRIRLSAYNDLMQTEPACALDLINNCDSKLAFDFLHHALCIAIPSQAGHPADKELCACICRSRVLQMRLSRVSMRQWCLSSPSNLCCHLEPCYLSFPLPQPHLHL